ncbi:hypothetical protein FRC09_013059 [Ceratobasidium sp. 395]|nr:hypothetical protein FRC09_013059 [Ceratobasidium sp. 395]
MSSPTNDEYEDLLLSCRYGDIDDVRAFVEKFGTEAVASARDENGNTVLHMTCANGHEVQNASKSTALHWATTNKHLNIVQKLAGSQPSLIDIKNAAGRTPLGEAEMAEWDEGAQWMVGAMPIEDADIKEGVTDEAVEEGDVGKETKDT